MHTAEHILNSVMDKMYHCGRSFNSHIEERKSKCDYRIKKRITDKEIAAVERTVNEIIRLNTIPVSIENLGGWSRQLRAWGYKDIPEKYLVM